MKLQNRRIRHPAKPSPSSRRAWIEIKVPTIWKHFAPGRPPRGGRGLKYGDTSLFLVQRWSPSSRRAWIEIADNGLCRTSRGSPSSRRAWIEIDTCSSLALLLKCRPPRGGRGLKLTDVSIRYTYRMCRPPRGGRGLKSPAAAAWHQDAAVALLAEGVD